MCAQVGQTWMYAPICFVYKISPDHFKVGEREKKNLPQEEESVRWWKLTLILNLSQLSLNPN